MPADLYTSVLLSFSAQPLSDKLSTEITVKNFLKHEEKVKAIKLYYHMHNTESNKCTLVEARDYVEQLKTKMKERGEL